MLWLQFISVIAAAFIGSLVGTIWRERAFKRERADQIVRAVADFVAEARACEDYAQGTLPNVQDEKDHGNLHPDSTYTPDKLLDQKFVMWNRAEYARLMLDEDNGLESTLDQAIARLRNGVGIRAGDAALAGRWSREAPRSAEIENAIESVYRAAKEVRRELQGRNLFTRI